MRTTLPTSPFGRTLAACRAVALLGLLASCSSGSSYTLVVVGASLPSVDPSGHGCSTWDCVDPAHTDPDPYVVVTSSSGEFRPFQSDRLADTLEPRWDFVVSEDQDVETLTHPITIDVYDHDPDIPVLLVFNENDHIARFQVALTADQIRPGDIVLSAPVGAGVATLTLQIR